MKQHAAFITVQRKDTFNPMSLTMTLGDSTLSSTLYHSEAVDFPMSVIVRLGSFLDYSEAVDFPMSVIVRLGSFLDYTLGVSVVRHEAYTWSTGNGTSLFTSDVANTLEGMYRAALLNAIVECEE